MEFDDDSVFGSVAVVRIVGGATHVENNHTLLCCRCYYTYSICHYCSRY